MLGYDGADRFEYLLLSTYLNVSFFKYTKIKSILKVFYSKNRRVRNTFYEISLIPLYTALASKPSGGLQ